MGPRTAWIAGSLSCALAASAAAQDMIGNPRAGEELAREVCAECHWVVEDQFVIPETGAPSFFQIADNPGYTPIAIRVFLRTPHRTMPDLILTQDETDDVIAYIVELRDKR